jgi:hypothetical protein
MGSYNLIGILPGVVQFENKSPAAIAVFSMHPIHS